MGIITARGLAREKAAIDIEANHEVGSSTMLERPKENNQYEKLQAKRSDRPNRG